MRLARLGLVVAGLLLGRELRHPDEHREETPAL